MVGHRVFEECVHRGCGLGLLARHHVRVGVQREGQIRRLDALTHRPTSIVAVFGWMDRFTVG